MIMMFLFYNSFVFEDKSYPLNCVVGCVFFRQSKAFFHPPEDASSPSFKFDLCQLISISACEHVQDYMLKPFLASQGALSSLNTNPTEKMG